MLGCVPQRFAAKAAEAKLKYSEKFDHGRNRSASPSSSKRSRAPRHHADEITSSSSASSKSSLERSSRKHSVTESSTSDDDGLEERKIEIDIESTLPPAKLKRSNGDIKTYGRGAHSSRIDNMKQSPQIESPCETTQPPDHAESSPTPSSTPLRLSKRSAAQAAQGHIQRAYAETSSDADLDLDDLPRRAKARCKGKERDAQFDPPRSKTSPSRPAAGSAQALARKPRRFQDSFGVYELQAGSCQTRAYAKWRRCVQCVAKLSGDSCRFVDFRVFPVDSASDHIFPADDGCKSRPSFISSPGPDEVMKLPVDRTLKASGLVQVETIVAKSVLPILEAELEHAKGPKTLRRPRETKCRQMCELCATSIFSASWFCNRCGREYCSDCKGSLESPDGSDPIIEKRLQRCDQKRSHTVADLIPLTRFDIAMLEQEVEAMRKMLADHKEEPASKQQQMSASAMEASTQEVNAPTSYSEEQDDQEIDWDTVPEEQAGLTADRVIGSLRLRTFDSASFDTDSFGREWSYGEPLLVRDVTGAMKHSWGPEELAARYGNDSCHIVRSDSDTALPKEVSVGKFFATFGCDAPTKKEALGKGSWKLKDWPPSAEFKVEFPELYEDFNRAVPAPEYTTREGALNLGSCYPEDVLQPDLGPKMYNAWPASEGPGGQGTTRLHMDMADAVNIMLYTATLTSPDTPPEHAPGVAAWDIFRAEDADKIRAFLRKEHAHLNFKDDPIHIQRFFIDAPQRVKLFREYGVRSWRIYQKQGEAVFIPAGCAHQVCNLTDCVKVAIDFVSPQNVDRCFKLTAEFRELVKDYKKAWKEDVLALRTTLWYAWCTYREMSGTGPNVWAKEQAAKKKEQQDQDDGDRDKLVRIEKKVEQGV